MDEGFFYPPVPSISSSPIVSKRDSKGAVGGERDYIDSMGGTRSCMTKFRPAGPGQDDREYY
jgi:hypothetical protein